MNIVQLLDQAKEVEQKIIDSEGELTNELETLYQSALEMKADKVDRLKWVMDKLHNEAEFYIEQAEELAQRAKVLNARREQLKDYLKVSMVNRGIEKLEGNMYSFKVYPHKGSLIVEEDRLSREYFMTVTETKVDKEKIKQHLKDGKVIEGAYYKEGWAIK